MEYTPKFIIENIAKANLSNTLKISDSIKDKEIDFCNGILKYIDENTNENNISKFSKILDFINLYMDKLNSNFKYNKEMLTDELIINIWGAMK